MIYIYKICLLPRATFNNGAETCTFSVFMHNSVVEIGIS